MKEKLNVSDFECLVNPNHFLKADPTKRMDPDPTIKPDPDPTKRPDPVTHFI